LSPITTYCAANCSLVIDPTNSSVLYVSGFVYGSLGFIDGVVKSTDGGLTWTNISTNLPTGGVLAIDPSNTANLYVAQGGGEKAFITKLNSNGTQLLYSTY